MCGIAGVVNRRAVPLNDYSVIDNMLERIRHRGPDDTGVCGISLKNILFNQESGNDFKEYIRGMLGFNRLSIQDITYAGHQPMQSADKSCVITFNGEIYNVKELRQELEHRTNRFHFNGNSDTEVVLYMYQEYGFYETIKKLNGMFAIVIYDINKKTLFMARDRYGIIPLHLCIDEGQIIWSSEIKAFLEVERFKREISEESIVLNTRYAYPNDSLFKQIDNMEPGTILEWQEATDNIKVVKYYDINEIRQRQYDSSIDYLEEAKSVLKDCVNRQLIGDVDLGVQLSGGVDSTLLAKIVADEFAKQNRQLNGFAMTNHDTPGYDEEKWIDYVAALNNINNRKEDMKSGRFIEALEHSIYAFERPFYTLPPVGIYLFSKRASEEVKILTSGEGADEVGGGYPELFGRYYSYSTLFVDQPDQIPKEYDSINGGMEFVEYFDKIKQMDDCKDFLISANLNGVMEKRYDYWKSLTGTPFDKMRKMHFKYRLISMCERQNKVCMASSVENRVPFLDNKFVDYMFGLPEELLMHKTTDAIKNQNYATMFEGKEILKQLSAQIYGQEFAYRKKQAIHAPLAKYFSDASMINYVNEIIVPGMKRRQMIDVDSFLNRMNHLDQSANVVNVWKYVNLELWCQFFIDGRREFYC